MSGFFFPLSMENSRVVFSGREQRVPEDQRGFSSVPLSFSYTPFSVQIPNDYSNTSPCWPLQHRPTVEQTRAYPSAWSRDFTTHDVSYPLCCDLSDSGVSLCAPEDYYSGVYNEFLGPTVASHTWTPGEDVHYRTSSAEVCDADSSLSSRHQKIFSTLVSSRQQNQTASGPSFQPRFCPQPPNVDTAGQHKNSIRSDKLKKPCHCTKSQCLKLYCDCFANGEICSGCSCVNCFNNTEHMTERNNAIKTCLGRNPEAFRSKMNSSVRGDVRGIHSRGCHCKSSGCLKNYCECYKTRSLCSFVCKCVGCNNYSRSVVEKTFTHPENNNTHSEASVSCITDAVVAATCGCLLAQAEEMMKRGVCGVQAERATLEEFGYCLSQIVNFMFKHTHTHR